MKIGPKYLGIVTLAVAALTWFSVDVHSTEEEERDTREEDPAAREAFRRHQLEDENGQIPPNAWRQAYEQTKAMEFRPEAWNEFLQGNGDPVPNVLHPWVSIGPGNIGGRVRSLIIHPTTLGKMWAGAVSGGVWRTTDGGTSWTTNTDLLSNLAVNCMVIDPGNPNILYAGTGEGFFNNDAVRGDGIFKTMDGGNSWTRLPSTDPQSSPEFYYVNRLAISPTNPQLLLAVTKNPAKILRSTDGGGNWTTRLILSTSAEIAMQDVIFRPPSVSPSVPQIGAAITCLATSNSGHFYYSTNDGLDWTLASQSGLPSTGRIELAYSPSNPAIVYASAEAGGRLYRSTDGGSSFVAMGGPPKDTPNWYNNVVWVDPTNSNTVLVGGASLWRNTQGGAGSWEKIRIFHPDHHVIVQDPGYDGTTNKIVYGGNDGGIYKGDALLSPSQPWQKLNHNLAITQFYGAAGNVASGTIVGGAQDQGILRFRPQDGPESWHIPFDGDGGFCAADQTDPEYFYGEYIYLQIYRSTDGGNTAYPIWNGPDGIPKECGNQICAEFIAPFVLDPNNPRTMLAGGRSLWRTLDVKATQPVWREVKAPIITNRNISAIAVAPGNSDVIWVGYTNGSVYYTTTGTKEMPSWTLASNGLPARYCTRITIAQPAQGQIAVLNDPEVGSTTYVTFGGFSENNVWKTENNGGNWTAISGACTSPCTTRLPSLPIHSLLISPLNPNKLYVGTELGVFATANGGQTWSPSSVDHPNVPVAELFWMGTKLVSATHGRGMFTLGH